MYIVLAACKFCCIVVFLLERVKSVIYIVIDLHMEINESQSYDGADLHVYQT